jgi:hypothetical protein
MNPREGPRSNSRLRTTFKRIPSGSWVGSLVATGFHQWRSCGGWKSKQLEDGLPHPLHFHFPDLDNVTPRNLGFQDRK